MAAKPTALDFRKLPKLPNVTLSDSEKQAVVEFSRDGCFLACGGRDKNVRVFDAHTRELIRELTGMSRMINGIAWSPSSQLIAACGNDESVKLWRFSDGELLTTKEGFTGGAYSVEFSPDGNVLAVSGKSQTCFFNLNSPEYSTLHSIPESEPCHKSIAFSPNCFTLAVSKGTTVAFYDVGTGQQTKELSTEHSDEVTCLRWSQDGSLLATASKDCTIRLFEYPDLQCIAKLEGHQACVNNVRFLMDDSLVVSCSDDPNIQVYDFRADHGPPRSDESAPKRGRLLKMIGEGDSSMFGLAVSPNQTTLVCNSGKELMFWSLPSPVRHWHRIDVHVIPELQSTFLRRKTLEIDLSKCKGKDLSAEMITAAKDLSIDEKRVLAKQQLFDAVQKISKEMDERTMNQIIIADDSKSDGDGSVCLLASLSGAALFQTCVECIMCDGMDERLAVLLAGLLMRVQPESTAECNSMLATLIQSCNSIISNTSHLSEDNPRWFVKSMLEMSAMVLSARIDALKSSKMSLFSPKCEFHVFIDKRLPINFAECGMLCDLLIAEFIYKISKKTTTTTAIVEELKSEDTSTAEEEQISDVPKNAARSLWNNLAQLASLNVKKKQRDWRMDALLTNAIARAALLISTILEPKADDPGYDGSMDGVIEDSVSVEVISAMISSDDVKKPGLAYFLSDAIHWQCQSLAGAFIAHLNSLCSSAESFGGESLLKLVPSTILSSPLSTFIMKEWNGQVASRLYGYVKTWDLEIEHFDDYDALSKSEDLWNACRLAVDSKIIEEMLDEIEKVSVLTNPLAFLSYLFRACVEFGSELKEALIVAKSVEDSVDASAKIGDGSSSKQSTDKSSIEGNKTENTVPLLSEDLANTRRRCVRVMIGRLLCVRQKGDSLSDLALPNGMIEYWLPILTKSSDEFQPLSVVCSILASFQIAYQSAKEAAASVGPSRSVAVFQNVDSKNENSDTREEKKDESGLEVKMDPDDPQPKVVTPKQSNVNDLSSVMIGYTVGEAQFAAEVVAYLLELPPTLTSKDIVQSCRSCILFAFPKIMDDRAASVLVPIISHSPEMAKEFEMDIRTVTDATALMAAVNEMDVDKALRLLGAMKTSLVMSKLKNHTLLASALMRIRFALFVSVKQFSDEVMDQVGGPDQFHEKVLPLIGEIRRQTITVLRYITEHNIRLSREWMIHWNEKVFTSFTRMESAVNSLNPFKDDIDENEPPEWLTDEMKLQTRKHFDCIDGAFKEVQILHSFYFRSRGGNGATSFSGLCDWEELRRVHKFETAHRGTIYGLSISYDSSMLVTGGKDSSVRLFDLQTLTEIHHFQGHTNEINGITCSTMGLWAASGADDDQVLIWNLAIPDQKPRVLNHDNHIWSVTWSRSAHWLAVAIKNSFHVWNTSSWERSYSVTDSYTSWRRIDFNGMEEDVLGICEETDVVIYNVRSQRVLIRLSDGFSNDVRTVKFSRNGVFVAAGSKDSTARVWNWGTGECIATLKGHTDWVNNIRWVADDSMVVTVSDDKKVSFWSVAEETVKYSIESQCSSNIYGMDISEDERYLAFQSDNEVYLYELPGYTGSWFKSGLFYAEILDLVGLAKALPFNETAESYVADLMANMSVYYSSSKSPRKSGIPSVISEQSKRKNMFDVMTVISEKRRSGELKIAPLFSGLVRALVQSACSLDSCADAWNVLLIGRELRTLTKQAVDTIVDPSQTVAKLKGSRTLVLCMLATIQEGVEKIARTTGEHIGWFTGTEGNKSDSGYQMMIVNQLEIAALIADNGLDLSEEIVAEMEGAPKKERRRNELRSLLKKDASWEDASSLVSSGTSSSTVASLLVDFIFAKLSGEVALKSLFELSEASMIRSFGDWRITAVIMGGLCRLAEESPAYGKIAVESTDASKKGLCWFLSEAEAYQSRRIAADLIAYFVSHSAHSVSDRPLEFRLRLEWDDRVAIPMLKCLEEWKIPDLTRSEDSRLFKMAGMLVSEIQSIIQEFVSNSRKSSPDLTLESSVMSRVRLRLDELSDVNELDNPLPLISALLRSYTMTVRLGIDDVTSYVRKEVVRLCLSVSRPGARPIFVTPEMKQYWDEKLGSDCVMSPILEWLHSPALTAKIEAIKSDHPAQPGLLYGLYSSDADRARKTAECIVYLAQNGSDIIQTASKAAVTMGFPRILDDNVVALLMPIIDDVFANDKHAVAKCVELRTVLEQGSAKDAAPLISDLHSIDLNELRNPVVFVSAVLRCRLAIQDFSAFSEAGASLRRLVVMITRHIRSKDISLPSDLVLGWLKKLEVQMNAAESQSSERFELEITNGVLQRLLDPPKTALDSNEEVECKVMKHHTSHVYGLSWSKDGRFIASGCKSNSIGIWCGVTYQFLREINEHTDEVNGVHISPNCQYVAGCSDENQVRVFDIHTGEQLTNLTCPDSVFSCAFSPDGESLAAAAKGDVFVWNTSDWSEKQHWTDSGKSWRRIDWHPSRPLLAVPQENFVQIYNAHTGEVGRTLSGKHTNDVRCVRFSHSGLQLASVSKDSSVCVWTLSGVCVWRHTEFHSDWINNIRWNRNDSCIITCSDDHKVLIIDVATKEVVRSLIGADEHVYSLDLSPNGRRIIAGNGKNFLLWTLPSVFGNWLRLSDDFNVTLELSGVAPPLKCDGCTLALDAALEDDKLEKAMDEFDALLQNDSETGLFAGLLRSMKLSNSYLTLVIAAKLRSMARKADFDTAQAMVASVAEVSAGMPEGPTLFQLQTIGLIAHCVPDSLQMAKVPIRNEAAVESSVEESKEDPPSEEDLVQQRLAQFKEEQAMAEATLTLYADLEWKYVSRFIEQGKANTVEAAMLTDLILERQKGEAALKSLWKMIDQLSEDAVNPLIDAVFIQALAHIAQEYPDCRAEALKSVDKGRLGLAYFLECSRMESRVYAVHTLAHLSVCSEEAVSMTALGLLIPRLHMESDERVMAEVVRAMQLYKLPVTSFEEDRQTLDTAADMVRALRDGDSVKAEQCRSQLTEVKVMRNPRPLLGYFLRACVNSERDSELRTRFVNDCIRAALCVTLPDGTGISLSRQMSEHWSSKLEQCFSEGSKMTHSQRILVTVISRLRDNEDDPLRSCLASTKPSKPGIAYFLHSSDWDILLQTMEVVRFLLENGSEEVKDLATEIVYSRYQFEDSYESATKFTSIAKDFFDEDIQTLQLSADLDQAVLDQELEKVATMLTVRLSELDVGALANPFILLRSVLVARLAVFCESPETGAKVRRFLVSVRRHVKKHKMRIHPESYRDFISRGTSMSMLEERDGVEMAVFEAEKRDISLTLAIINRMIRQGPVSVVKQASDSSEEGDDFGLSKVEGHHDVEACQGTIYGMSFSNDCSMMASGGKDNIVRIFNPETRELIHTLQGHTNEINHVMFAPDSVYLSSCGDDKSIRIWNCLNGECVMHLSGYDDVLYSTAWSFDCSLLAGASKNEIRVYRVSDWTEMYRRRDNSDSWRRINFSLHDYTLAVGTESRAILYNALTNEELLVLDGQHTSDIRATVFSHSGSLIATCSKDYKICLWDAGTGEHLSSLTGHTDWVNNVRFFPGDQFLVSCSDDKNVTIWDTQEGRALHSFSAPDGNNYALGLTSNGRLLATCHSGRIRIWELPVFFSQTSSLSTDFTVCSELSGVQPPLKDSGDLTDALLSAIQSDHSKSVCAEFHALCEKTKPMLAEIMIVSRSHSVNVSVTEEDLKLEQVDSNMQPILQLITGLIRCLSDVKCNDYSVLMLSSLLRRCCLAVTDESAAVSILQTLVDTYESGSLSVIASEQVEMVALLIHGKWESPELDVFREYSEISESELKEMMEKGTSNFLESALLGDLALSKFDGTECLNQLFEMHSRCNPIKNSRFDCLSVGNLASLARRSPELAQTIVESDSPEKRGLAYFVREGSEGCRSATVGILAELAGACAPASSLLSQRSLSEWSDRVAPQMYAAMEEWELKLDGFDDSEQVGFCVQLSEAVRKKDIAAAEEATAKMALVSTVENPLPMVSALLRSMLELCHVESAQPLRRRLLAELVRFQYAIANRDGSYASIPAEMAKYWKSEMIVIDQPPPQDPDLPVEEPRPLSAELAGLKALVSAFGNSS